MSKRYLSDEERFVIADGVRAGGSKRSIATELGRSVSTVCREVARNAEPSGEYRPHAAQQRMLARRPRPKHRRVALSIELRGLVQERLDKRWSPEQISKSLRSAVRPDLTPRCQGLGTTASCSPVVHGRSPRVRLGDSAGETQTGRAVKWTEGALVIAYANLQKTTRARLDTTTRCRTPTCRLLYYKL